MGLHRFVWKPTKNVAYKYSNKDISDHSSWKINDDTQRTRGLKYGWFKWFRSMFILPGPSEITKNFLQK